MTTYEQTCATHKSVYEVLYNSDYGGFSFPDEFIKEVFRRFPPESEEGKQLWEPTHDSFIQARDPPPANKYTHRIVRTEEFCHGYKWIYYQSINNKGVPEKHQPHVDKPSKYCTKDFVTYYYVYRSYARAWRTLPSIIAMAREFKLIHTKDNPTEMRIAKIPIGYDYRIREYDGMESVHPTSPTEAIIADLLRLVQLVPVGSVGSHCVDMNPLTKRLLEGAPLRDILNPTYGSDSDSGSEEEQP